MEEGTAAACGTACGAMTNRRNIRGMWHVLRSDGQTEETPAACGTGFRSGWTSSTCYNSDVRISYYLLWCLAVLYAGV